MTIYGSPVLQAMVGVNPQSAMERPQKSARYSEMLKQRIDELKAGIGSGGLREAVIRGLLYVGMTRGMVDERSLDALRQVKRTNGATMTLADFKAVVREQFFMLLLDENAALAAIPKMLPQDENDRRKGLAAIRNVLSASGDISGETAVRLEEIAQLFGLEKKETTPDLRMMAS